MKASSQKKNKKDSLSLPKEQLKEEKYLKKYYYLIGLFTFFIFANTISNGYNMDDGIVTNGHKLTSQGLSAIGEIFTSNYYSDNMGYAFGYRPIVHLSFAIEHELFGEKPGAGHFINVILFAISVVLFFKLLIKWMGEKNLLFAGIAAILFAVHPIHTEVVDSLKNRDELLAFFFVIWAGLSAHKYLDKGKWISLVSIFILFSMAMLSKKSVYPMAIVIPAAIILIKDISVKKFLVLCILFVFPAAIIGSELQYERAGLMILIPIIVLIFLYVFKSNVLSTKEKSNYQDLYKLKGIIIPVSMIVLIAIMAPFFNYWVLLASVPFLFWLFRINYELGIVLLFIVLIGLDILWLQESKLGILILMLGFGYSLYRFLDLKKLNILWVSIGIISLFYFAFHNFKLSGLAILIATVILIFASKKRILWVLIFSVLALISAPIIGKLNLYNTLLFLISISLFFFKRTKNQNWIQYTAVIAFSVTIVFMGYENHLSGDTKSIQLAQNLKKEKFVKNENILKEGRQLEFVENTLVASHSKEEKIGTGFATLGEYFRLMVFPYELSFYYGYAKTDTFSLKNIWIWLIILVHLAMLFLAIFHLKKNPMISIGVFWYLLCILLFSNWVELVAGMVGERLAFTASAGFCIFLVGVIFWIKPDLNFKQPGIIGISTIFILTIFAGRTIVRNTDWKDTITLMGNDINHLKNSSQANNIYAMHLMAESTNNRSLTVNQVQDLQKTAIKHFEQATEVWPDYFNVYIDKARAYMVMGDYQPAIKSLQKAIEIDPKNEYSYYIIVDAFDKIGDGESYLKYGKILFGFRQNEQTYGVLARGYYLINEKEKSKEILLEALQKYPNNEPLKYNLNLVNQELN